jgi:hypothetical protein
MRHGGLAAHRARRWVAAVVVGDGGAPERPVGRVFA